MLLNAGFNNVQVRMVIALGGNAFSTSGARVGSPDEQWERVKEAARDVMDAVEMGYDVLVTHGNGPQVGALAECGLPLTLDMHGAATQGWLGYLLATAIDNEAVARRIPKKTIAVVTRVYVNEEDPAFNNPTKFVGPIYSEEEAVKLSQLRGWRFKPDPRGGMRRVVPSPMPVSIIEVKPIIQLMDEGYIVISTGGGGVPVTGGSQLRGVEAVIDKDLASQLLAATIAADAFVILTDIDGIYTDFGKPAQRKLSRIDVVALRSLYEKGEFPPGNMGPKVLAAINFVEKSGKAAYIGRLGELRSILEGRSGTTIIS
jgi:carbamate kinase